MRQFDGMWETCEKFNKITTLIKQKTKDNFLKILNEKLYYLFNSKPNHMPNEAKYLF